jgi:GT2 family glycosyltransferase
MPADEPDFAVVVCTRNRSTQLRSTLEALERQTDPAFPILVVDQSDDEDVALSARAASVERLTVMRDGGRGLSRARNIGLGATRGGWIVFVDDDCITEPGWAAALRGEFARHPEASLVSGHVGPGGSAAGDELEVAVFPVTTPRRRSGRWTHPGHLCFGVCFAVRRSTAERLGGWDERLGPGVQDFPAADDMDFNYRFLRSGGVAWASPLPRARHEQWRTSAELTPLNRGYLAAWTGFAVKHFRSGDRLGGSWLWAVGMVDVAHMFFEAVRQRSPVHLTIARAKLAGLVEGTRKGFSRAW